MTELKISDPCDILKIDLNLFDRLQDKLYNKYQKLYYYQSNKQKNSNESNVEYSLNLIYRVLTKIFETHQLIYISPNNSSSFSHVNNIIWAFTFEAVFVARSILDDALTGVFDPIKFLEDQVTNRDFGPEISLLSWWQ